MRYATPPGGLPPQTQLMTDRAIFTEAYAVIPKGVQRDIVTSLFPGWEGARGWILARPLSGFAETFSWTIMELSPGGGSDAPEADPEAAAALFLVSGEARVEIGDDVRSLGPGGFAYLPPGCGWKVRNERAQPAVFHWVRKAWEPAPGITPPDPIFCADASMAVNWMPDSGEVWGTTRFIDANDLRHDFHLNVVTFKPGGVIPFAETHVMEHGLYVLEGKAVYRLNGDWVEVEAGDFMWLRAFCPQGCYAAGPGNFRYLLYKDVNRLPRLRLR